MKTTIRRIAAVLTLALSAATLPAFAVSAQAAPAKASTHLTHVSFSTSVKSGRTYLTIAGNVKKVNSAHKLTVYNISSGKKHKLSSCTTLAKCSVYLSNSVTKVAATSGGYHAKAYTVKLRSLKLSSFAQQGKRILNVQGNVAHVPTKTPVRVYDATSKKKLVQCTTLSACRVTLSDSTVKVYATSGAYRTKSIKVPLIWSNGTNCADLAADYACYPYNDFKNLHLSVQSTTIAPPSAGGSSSGNMAAVLGSDTLTVTGLPDYSELQKYGLALYIFEVNNRDSTIAQETDLGDGHLLYPADKNGNPTFTLSDWVGNHSHTYVAAIGSENRPQDRENTLQTTFWQQPTFDTFMSNPATFGAQVFLSNPVTVKPVKEHPARFVTAFDKSDGFTYATLLTDFINYSDLSPALLTMKNWVGLDSEAGEHMWGDWYNDSTAALAWYKENIEGEVPGATLDYLMGVAQMHGYPDIDATWDYEIKYQNDGDESWLTETKEDNAPFHTDEDGRLQGGAAILDGTVRFVYARWAGRHPVGTIYSVAATGHPVPVGDNAGPVEYPSNTCDPNAPITTDGGADQFRYAATDVLSGGALSSLDAGMKTGLVKPCSIQYILGNSAMRSAIVTFAGSYRFSGALDEVTELETEMYSQVSGLAKLANPETSAEGAKELVLDHIKTEAARKLRQNGCGTLSKYFIDTGYAANASECEAEGE